MDVIGAMVLGLLGSGLLIAIIAFPRFFTFLWLMIVMLTIVGGIALLTA